MSRRIRPTYVEVDLNALAANFRRLRGFLGNQVNIVAVLKANAYGHGAVALARSLEGIGIWGYGVATVEEAVQLREAGIRLPIVVLGAAFGNDHQEVIARNLIPLVGDFGDVEAFAVAARHLETPRFGLHLKIDTGMLRLGITEENFPTLLRYCLKHSSVRADGLATHLATAEEESLAATTEQLAAFERCLSAARSLSADPQCIHTANTAAALRVASSRYGLVRIGIGLYGCRPSRFVPDLGLEPVLSWHTQVVATRDVPAGRGVGYGATFVTARRSRIATVPVGYADGYSRGLSNCGYALVHGQRVGVVGQVCMDSLMLDVTEVAQTNVGDHVTLLGRAPDGGLITAEDLATWSGTIPHEVLSCISGRVPRYYSMGSRGEVKPD